MAGAALIVGVIGLSLMMCWRNLTGLPPFGGTLEGQVVTKNIVTHQSRFGTRTEYVVQIATTAGPQQTVVPPQVYNAVRPGFVLKQNENRFTVVSPGGQSRTFTRP